MTEKNYNPDQKTRKALKKQPKQVAPDLVETKMTKEQEVQANAEHSEEEKVSEDKIEDVTLEAKENETYAKEEHEIQANAKHSKEKEIVKDKQKTEEHKEKKTKPSEVYIESDFRKHKIEKLIDKKLYKLSGN